MSAATIITESLSVGPSNRAGGESEPCAPGTSRGFGAPAATAEVADSAERRSPDGHIATPSPDESHRHDDRLNYVDEHEAMELLTDALDVGLDTDRLKRHARSVRNWSEWRSDMFRMLDEARGASA